MFKNYFRVAVNTLLRNKVNSFINIFGLAIGIACCTVILLYVAKELSYDNYHHDLDRLYRVAIWKDVDGLNRGNASVPYPTAEVLLTEYPEVERAGRMVSLFQQDPVIRIDDQLFIEKHFYFADQSILDLLTVDFIKGDSETALLEPNSMVLTEETARKYFGSIDVLGRTVTADMNEMNLDFKITGVVRNCPENTHFQYQLLVPLDNYFDVVVPFFRERIKSWFMLNFWTYIRLAPGTNPQQLEAKLTKIVENNFAPTRQDSEYFLQPVKDIHLYSNIDGELGPNNDIMYVYIFSIIAFLVLLVACINFMNLTTAKSVDRAKEVGLRKVVGAQRTQLIRQFLFESTLTAIISVLIALGLVEVFRNLLVGFAGVSITVNYLEPRFLLAMLSLALLVGLLSGLYPAFSLSGFQPVQTLKGVFGRSKRGRRLRTALAVIQIAISVVLLVGVLAITEQLDYIRNKRLGFDKDQMLLINLRGTALMNGPTYESFKARLLQLREVQGVTKSIQVMGRGASMRSVYFYDVTDDRKVALPFLTVGHDFATTYNLEIIEGRDISSSVVSDTNHIYLVNEAAVKQFNLDPVVGRIITTGDYPKNPGPIVGIVKDFHYGPLHEPIGPMVIGLWNRPLVYISVKLQATAVPEAVEQIESIWAEFETNRIMDFSFLDNRLNQAYQFENMLGKVVTAFTFLAILVACLGLFGMALYATEQRAKEIGIRKVLGASMQSILLSFSYDFVKIIVIANVIAWPIAYLAMREWLNDFAYRVQLGSGLFLTAFLTTLIVALLTITYQSVKAGRSDPIKALRYE